MANTFDPNQNSGSGGGGYVSPDNRTPTGIENPFNWVVDGGDIVGIPESYITPEGKVPGLENLFDGERWNLNPVGDIVVDPNEESYTVGPDGATPNSSINQELSSISERIANLLEQDAQREQEDGKDSYLFIGALFAVAVAAIGVMR